MQKTAIVTGHQEASVEELHPYFLGRRGKVFVTARNKAALDSLKREAEEFAGAGEIIPYVLDQNNDKEVDKFSEEILGSNNKIDLLVNSAYQGLIAMTPHFGKRFWERPISV